MVGLVGEQRGVMKLHPKPHPYDQARQNNLATRRSTTPMNPAPDRFDDGSRPHATAQELLFQKRERERDSRAKV